MKKNFYRTLLLIIVLFFISSIKLFAFDNHDIGSPKKIFTKEDIRKIADAYVNNNLHKENPVFIDLRKIGVFDMLVFNNGIVEYYKNTETLEEPFFVLENAHYDKYEIPPVLKTGMPMPIFFADTKGYGKMDMFAIEKLNFNDQTNKYDYRILHEENVLGLDTGTLITIILVLVIVLLLLAILGR